MKHQSAGAARIIFVGADPHSPHIAHAGGQLTASMGLKDYAHRHDLLIDWVDTTQSNFPPPPLASRIVRGMGRLGRFTRLAMTRRYDGAILYGGSGASFFERSMMALVGRVVGLRVALFIVSGHFVDFYEKRTALRPLIQLLLRIPYTIGVQGESWRRFYVGAGVPDDRIVTVKNWYLKDGEAPASQYRAGHGTNPVRFVFVGWMVAEKGVREILAAVRNLADRGVAFELVMIGGGTLLEDVQAAAASPSLADRFEVIGWMPHKLVMEKLAGAGVLLLPSYAEGFPNVLLEAMAQGLAIIATPVGAIPDSLTHGTNGLIVPPRDVVALEAAMLRYCTDPALARRHGRSGRSVLETEHDLDTNVGKLLETIDRRSNRR